MANAFALRRVEWRNKRGERATERKALKAHKGVSYSRNVTQTARVYDHAIGGKGRGLSEAVKEETPDFKTRILGASAPRPLEPS